MQNANILSLSLSLSVCVCATSIASTVGTKEHNFSAPPITPPQTMSQQPRSVVVDALYFDFDLTLSNTSIDAALIDNDTGESKENQLTVEECRAVFEAAANKQDGSLLFTEYCEQAQQFFTRMQTMGVAVVMLSNNNGTNITNGMEAMCLHFSGDVLSLHELRKENPNVTKATVLYQHGVEHGYTAAVFVDDSASQCESMRTEFVEKNIQQQHQIKLNVVKVPKPEKNTTQKGGLFNFPDTVREVEEALLLE